VPNFSADSYGVYTHNNPSGAFRGFGSTQACFAAEIQMDKLARELGMTPRNSAESTATGPEP
jgi:CO/xanthine dehydrogenase Mo-binding subunit